ncbi:MAG: 2-amino-4-hydroxy-6-hydroxymethyldihydropteridine diphosphokinase [Gammaproteobacteria bacterium]
MSRAWIGLGSNQDEPARQVRQALAEMKALPDTEVVRYSRLYRTPPWGPVTGQPDYANAVAEVDTELAPKALLAALQAMETAHGRVRRERWGPRTLDLDLLLYDDLTMDTTELTLPHPRLAERAFVLVPLAELAPGLGVPGAALVSELLERVDTADVVAWERAS